MSIMNSSRGYIDGRAKESGESVATGAHKDCPPIFPSLAVQSCDNTIGNDGVASEAVSKIDAKEQHSHIRLQSDLSATDSPTIVKSKSLSKKIRERQTRDKAASDADRMIPSLYANGTTKTVSMLKSTSQSSNLSALEGNSGDFSDDSPPPVGLDGLGYLPMATVTPNRSRTTSASAPNLEGIASPDNVPVSQSLPLPLSWTTTHTNLTNIISSGAHSENVPDPHESKTRNHEGQNSPPSSQLASIQLSGANVSIYSNHSSARNALSSASSIAVTANPKVHHVTSSTKPLKDPHVHVVERTLPPKSLEKINHAELASTSSSASSSSRSNTHSRAAASAPNSSKLSALALSPAQTSAKSRAASSSTSTMMSLHGLQNPAQIAERQFLIALEGPPRSGPVTVEDDNDRIVQERLLEAKALDRGKASGAVMHQFSLWNKVPTKSAPPSQSTTEAAPIDKAVVPPAGNDESPRLAPSNRLSSLSPSLHNVSVSSETITASGKKLRGPKAALAIQSLADEETPRSGKLTNPFALDSTSMSSRSHSRTSSSDFLTNNDLVRASMSTVNSTPDFESNGIGGAGDRSFNSDTLDEDYTMEFEPLAGEITKAAETDICAIPLGGSAGSSLAAALRKKVGGAKQSSSSNESLQALCDGKGTEGSPVKNHDPWSDRIDMYVTPEKRANPFASAHAPLSLSAQNIEKHAAGNDENDNDGWYDDDFAEEDEELRRISERPRSAEGNNKRRSQSEIDTEAVIKSMSQSGPAAFASPRSAKKVNNDNHGSSSLPLHAPYARNATQSGSEKSPERGTRGTLTLSAPTSTSDKTSLRRATTSGESRLLMNQLEVLGHIEPDSPTTMKSMTSRSASEYNIPSADTVTALNARTAKGGSSKYQTLRNLKSNKSERFQITPMASAKDLLNKTGETTTASISEVDPNINNNATLVPAGDLQPTQTTEQNEQRNSEGSHDSAADSAAGGAEGEQNGEDDGEEEDRDDASPTLSELSETEDPHEMRQLQQQQQDHQQRQSPLRLEASHTFGTSSAENHEGLSRDQKEEEESPLRWKRGEAIGEGTFGKVYKGMNEKTGELLAIKQLALMDGSSAEVDSLRREISVMWNLEHENIVRYMGTSKTDRYLYIILEYVTGGSIAGMITQFGPFTEKLIKRFSFHILSGMEYLHSKGIVHRDIKGGNILVSDAGVAKLADFGCSKQLAGVCTGSIEESMKAIRGSVPWMAPEVIKQSGHGLPSDIWSFGATVIEMATGKPPWPEFTNSMAALFHVATSSTPPPMPDNVSSLCTDFLARCLVIEPADRFTAHQLLNETEFLRGSGVAAGIGSNTATTSSAAVIASSNNIGPSTSNAL